MRKQFGLFLLIVLLLANVTPGVAAGKAKLLATIDQQQISRAKFNKYLKLFKNSGIFSQIDPETRKKHLENLINRIVLLEEAHAEGYFETPELKKHGSLNSVEHETIVLRQLLTDRISRPATIDDKIVSTYLKTHTNLTFKQAQEKLTSERQLQLFQELMLKLKKKHSIKIYQENLNQI